MQIKEKKRNEINKLTYITGKEKYRAAGDMYLKKLNYK